MLIIRLLSHCQTIMDFQPLTTTRRTDSGFLNRPKPDGSGFIIQKEKMGQKSNGFNCSLRIPAQTATTIRTACSRKCPRSNRQEAASLLCTHPPLDLTWRCSYKSVEFIKGTLGKLSVPLFIPHKTTDTSGSEGLGEEGGLLQLGRNKQLRNSYTPGDML